MKKLKRALMNVSIKSLIVIYVIFIVISTVSFAIMGYMNIKQNENSLIHNAKSQLNFLQSRFDTSIQSVQYTVFDTIQNNPLNNFSNLLKGEDYRAQISAQRDILLSLNQQTSSSLVLGEIDIFWPEEDFILYSNTLTLTKKDELNSFFHSLNRSGWYNAGERDLYYVNFSPFLNAYQKAEQVNFLVAGKLRQDYLYNLLEQVNQEKNIASMIVLNNHNTVDTVNSTTPLKEKIITAVQETDASKIKNFQQTERVDGVKYQLLFTYHSRTKSWLVTYLKLPTFSKRNVQILGNTLALLSLLLVVSLFVGILFYYAFYKNLSLLIQGFKKTREERYDTRINSEQGQEFKFVFDSFNETNAYTEDLIMRLKNETSLRKDAEYRQLQAQINPHFLYNNFNFISSMAEKSPKSVELMTHHLAEYYRYLTNKNTGETTLEQELKFAENYLTIMSLRKQMDYFIDYPKSLADLPFMPLIIQPLVENAIYHGIEERIDGSQVGIIVEEKETTLLFQVIDDGKGLTQKEMLVLKEKLGNPNEKPSTSVGLWNVNQRLVNQYGKESQLSFSSGSSLSSFGLTVFFEISKDKLQK